MEFYLPAVSKPPLHGAFVPAPCLLMSLGLFYLSFFNHSYFVLGVSENRAT